MNQVVAIIRRSASDTYVLRDHIDARDELSVMSKKLRKHQYCPVKSS